MPHVRRLSGVAKARLITGAPGPAWLPRRDSLAASRPDTKLSVSVDEDRTPPSSSLMISLVRQSNEHQNILCRRQV